MNSNFQQKQKEEQASTTASQSENKVEFATPEEAIRFDAEQNPAPPEIAERLNKSLADEPKHETSFWTKLGFRKS